MISMRPDSKFRLLLNSYSRSNLLLQIALPVLLIVCAIVFQISSLYDTRDKQLAHTRLSAQELGSTLAASIAGSFQNIDLTLLSASDYLRNQTSLKTLDAAKFNASLNLLQRRVPLLLLLRATNENGDVLFGNDTENAEIVNISDRKYFQQLKNTPDAAMVISEPVLGKFTKKWVVICARRFNLAHGQFGGIIYGSVELEGFTERLSGRELKLSENDAFVLRDDHSDILIRYSHGKQDMTYVGEKITSPNIVAFDKSGRTSTTYQSNSAIDKVERIFYLQRIRDQPLSIIIGLSVSDALAGYRSEALKKWIGTAIFILVVLISFFLIHLEQANKLNVISNLENTSEKLKQLIKFNEAIFLNSPLPIGVYSADGQCIRANEALASLIGNSREVLLTQNIYLIPSWKQSGLVEVCRHVISNRSHSECEVHLATENGRQLIVECHLMSLQQNQDNLLLIQFIDLTEIKQLNSKLENILKSMEEGVHVIDDRGVIILENQASTSMLGWTDENILGRPAHVTMHHHRADRSFYPTEECPIHATLNDGQIRHVEDEVFWRRDGTCFPVEYTATPIMNPNGEGNAVTVVFRDITYRKKLEEELRRQATHDVLTGLPNRRLLMDRLGQALNINRRQNTHGALLFLDLNRFKELNDNFGHEAGDHVLIEVATRLTSVIRESDSVGRLGGDEFVVLLLGLDSEFDLAKKYVEIVAEKISRKLREDYVIGDIVHRGSASIGIKIFYHDDHPEKILKDADTAMYEMKKIRD